MAGVKHLAGLYHHLDDMFVAMPARTAAGIWVQEEDIHVSLVAGQGGLALLQFYCLS
jgi:hypothetical protein